MLSHYGFIYLSPGANPATDRTVTETGGQTTTLVAVPSPEAGVPVAAELASRGVQLLELCGVFGPVWTAKIIEATGGRIPVGAVAYGAESVAGLIAATAATK